MFRLVTFLLILIPNLSFAEDIGLSVRALGMGNAFTSIVDDSDSVFYNPAGLAQMSGFRWMILDPALGTNDAYDAVSNLTDTNDVNQTINELMGEKVNVYSATKSVFSLGSFAFGVYGIADLDLMVNNPVTPNIDTSLRIDYGFVIGTGINLVPKMFDIGIQARRIAREGGEIPIGVSTIATLDAQTIQDQLQRSGVGYAFDLGATLRFPGAFSPTLAFTWRDLGNTSFEPSSDNVTAPDPILSEQIIGAGFVYESVLLDIKTAIDYRYANDPSMQLGKKLNMGLEIGIPTIDIRAGLHQGYYTLGLGFDLWLMRVDAATFGVELGEYPGQLEDRRYMVQMTFEFGIDPGSFSFFKLSRPSVKNHSRKLRR